MRTLARRIALQDIPAQLLQDFFQAKGVYDRGTAPSTSIFQWSRTSPYPGPGSVPVGI